MEYLFDELENADLVNSSKTIWIFQQLELWF